MTFSSIAVIGDWHQAAVLSASLAKLGHAVTTIVADEASAVRFAQGRAPVFEPGLDDLIAEGLAAGRLRFTPSYAEGLRGSEFAFIAIDTPVDDEDRSDLGPILRAAESIALHAPQELILCVSAQVPVGTTAKLADVAGTHSRAYVPEFLQLGTALKTFFEADRIVVGSDDPVVAGRVAAIFAPLGRPIRQTDERSAEMAKHASNAFLATSVSFSNQIADLCEKLGADMSEVSAILRLDSRIGPKAFLSAGVGYAGGTLGREIRALQSIGRDLGVTTELLDAVNLVNSKRVAGLVTKLEAVGVNVGESRIAILGLTYKAGTSTLRRSAALQLIHLLHKRGATVTAYDPLADLGELDGPREFELAATPAAALKGASASVLLAPWIGIEGEDHVAWAAAMHTPILLDAGNILNRAAMERAGFTYLGIGR